MKKKSNSVETKPDEMDIWGHIGELRSRLFKSLIALAVTTVGSFFFAQQLIQLLTVPIGGLQNLISIEVTENISVFMKVSLLSGFIIALPFILYELLMFVMPALEPNERRWVLTAIPAATVLFVAGAAFAYLVMLPAALPFLVSFLGVTTTPRLSNYFSFVTNLLFWIGVSFETPLVIFVLAKLRLVNAKMLLAQWRPAIIVIAILAAVITPTPDPVNMGLLMLPLIGLYFLSILLAALA